MTPQNKIWAPNYEDQLEHLHGFPSPKAPDAEFLDEFKIPEDQKPGGTVQTQNCPVPLEFHKQCNNSKTKKQNSPLKFIDQCLGDCSGCALDEDNLDLVNKEEETQLPQELQSTSAPKSKAYQRQKDDKNGHKKFLSCLNKCLSASDKKLLKEKLKEIGQTLNPQKGSRYSFVLILLNIKFFLGDDKLYQLYERFREIIEPFLSKSRDNKEAYNFLKSLKPHFIAAFNEVIQGNYEESVTFIYRVNEKFRQQEYEARAMMIVRDHRKKLEQFWVSRNVPRARL